MIEIYYSHGTATVNSKTVTTVKENKQYITIIENDKTRMG